MYNENIENINKFNLQKTAEEQQHAKYKSRSIANSSAKMKRIYDGSCCTY